MIDPEGLVDFAVEKLDAETRSFDDVKRSQGGVHVLNNRQASNFRNVFQVELTQSRQIFLQQRSFTPSRP